MITVARATNGRIVHVIPAYDSGRSTWATACGLAVPPTWLIWATEPATLDRLVSCSRCERWRATRPVVGS